MIKKFLKILLFIGVILFVGQVRVSGRTIGDRFVSSLDTSAKWTKRKFNGESILGGFEFPKFELPSAVKEWMGKKKNKVSATTADADDFTEDAQAKLLHLLN